MDISYTTLDWLQQTNSDPLDLMREMLKHWLKSSIDPPPTWEAVVTALRSPIVNERYVAACLEFKYCEMEKCEIKESISPTRPSHSPLQLAVEDSAAAKCEGIQFKVTITVLEAVGIVN